MRIKLFLRATVITLIAGMLTACASSSTKFDQKQTFDNVNKKALVIVSARAFIPTITFMEYDTEKQQLVKKGKTFWIGADQAAMGDAVREIKDHILVVEPGTYVIATSTLAGGTTTVTAYSLGSLSFDVSPGEVLYLGQFEVRTVNPEKMSVGKVAGNFVKAFFTLGIAGMPDPVIQTIDIKFDPDRLAQVMKNNPSIKVGPHTVTYRPNAKFEASSTLIYFIKPPVATDLDEKQNSR